MKNQYKTPNLIKTQYSDQKCLNIMDFNNENPNLVTDEDTLEEGNENQNSTNSAEDTITLDPIFQLEQPLDLSLHSSSTSNLTDTSSGSLFNFEYTDENLSLEQKFFNLQNHIISCINKHVPF